MRKVKVMHLVETLGVGGMENGVVNLANFGDKSKFDISICCTGEPGKMAERITSEAVQLIALRNNSRGKQLGLIFSLKKILKKQKIDILHTHGWGSRSFVGILAAILARIPVCINGEHGYIFSQKKSQVWIQNILGRLVTGTLSVSKGLKDKLEEKLGYSGKSIHVIPNGVDTDKYSGDYDVEELRKTFGLDKDDFVVGVVGTLKPQKKQDLVCLAVAELKKQGIGVKLLLVGDGPDRASLEELVSRLGINKQVIFIGLRDDIYKIYCLLNVLVVSSISDHEGMSNVILEAMASGVPVLSTRSVGSNELIEDMKTGLFISNDNPSDLCRKLSLLINDCKLQASLKKNALDLIRSRHTLPQMVSNYENYYVNVLTNKGIS